MHKQSKKGERKGRAASKIEGEEDCGYLRKEQYDHLLKGEIKKNCRSEKLHQDITHRISPTDHNIVYNGILKDSLELVLYRCARCIHWIIQNICVSKYRIFAYTETSWRDESCESTGERRHTNTFSIRGKLIIEYIYFCVMTKKVGRANFY